MKVLGVDIGGTSVKIGVVDANGKILEKTSYETLPWQDEKGFIPHLAEKIAEIANKYPEIKSAGLGFPGLLSKDRQEVILLPNIPSVEKTNVIDVFKKELPEMEIHIENDAKCAALGELIFNQGIASSSFLFLTLGTGVGGALIIENELFKGANGNPTEIGHILTTKGDRLEALVGQRQIVQYAIEKYKSAGINKYEDDLTVKEIFSLAQSGDKIALHTFEYVGKLIGEALVNAIRLYDVNDFIFGGGVSGAAKFIFPHIENTIKVSLPSYYTDNLTIGVAAFSNDAGIMGAAALALHQYDEISNTINA